MLSKPCVTCGRALSPHAKQCPQCTKPGQPTPKHLLIGLGVALIAAIMLFVILPAIPNAKPVPAPSAGEQPSSTQSSYSPGQRVVFARYMEEEYQKNGWNVKLSATGPDKTTLLMTSPLFEGVTPSMISASPQLQNFKNGLKKNGFEKLIFSDGNMPVGEEYIY
jgi:hypothetical protein